MSDKNTKQFSLKGIEVQMLKTEEDQYFNRLSNFLSFIAMERLAYHVTEHTRFSVEGDKLTIIEDEPADDVSTVPDNTKEALK